MTGRTFSLEDLLNGDETAGDHFTVELSRGKMSIRGLGAGEIGALILRFPDLLDAAEGDNETLIGALTRNARGVVPALISLAADMPGERGEQAARRLSATDQVKAIAKIVELTFPEGIAGFLEEVQALAPAAPEPEADPDQLEMPLTATAEELGV